MKLFEDYIVKRSAAIKKNWKKYLEVRNDECLHQMRVELKKLIALLHFINDNDKGFDLQKQGKLPLHLLDICGDLRDHYNFDLLAEKFHFKVPSLQLQLEHFENQQALQKLQVYYRKHHTGISHIKKEVEKHLANLMAEQLEAYVAEIAKKIMERIEKGWVNDQLHDLRKKMKDVIYLHKLVEQKSGQSITDTSIKKMDELQDRIGQWHDLDKFQKKIREFKNTRPVKRTTDAIQAEEKKLLNEIYTLSQMVLEEAEDSVGA